MTKKRNHRTASAQSPNENCLEGWQCPSCKSWGPFSVEARCRVVVTDDGTDTDWDNGDVGWDDKSFAKCMECDKEATVSYFCQPEKAEREQTGKPREMTQHTPVIAAQERASALRQIAKRGNLWPEAIEELNEIAKELDTVHAAAPDLLGALKNLLIYDTGEMPGDFIEAAKNAIAKAEGRV